MRKEDRRAFLLHTELADTLLGVATKGETVPRVNDRDICRHCRRHQCVAVCPTGALTTRIDERLNIDADRCISCGACVVACFEFANLAWDGAGIAFS